jgi:replicative DNA helicase
MDVERSMIYLAVATGSTHTLISNGITANLFSATPTGQEAAAVLDYATTYLRTYSQHPSLDAIRRQFPDWHGETPRDSLQALIDEFLDEARKRYFEAAVLGLSTATRDRANWRRLDEIMLDAAREVAAVIPSGAVGRFSEDFERRIAQYEEDKNKGVRPGIPLGIPIIDEVMGGVKGGWLVTTAGFSGLGKTALVLVGLLSAFENDRQALMLSLEMSRAEVMDRLDTMVMNFSHRDLTRRQLDPQQVDRWRRIAGAYTKAKGEIVIIDKLGGCTLDRVHAEITRYKPDVVAVDYVQRMSGTRASMARWEGLEEITNGLKTIAMDTDSAVLMVSQDGRSSAEEGSTRSNMGGSVSVYQAADAYLGLQQDEAMFGQKRMRVKLLKFRHGDRAEVDMTWRPATGEFGKWEDVNAFTKQAVA